KILFPGQTIFDSSKAPMDPGGIAVIDPRNPMTWFATLRRVKAFRPDIVLVQWWNPFIAPALGTISRLLEATGIRCIFECHNVFPHERGLFDLPLVDFALSPIRTFITHSSSDRDLLLNEFPAKTVFVAPLPPPASSLEPSLSQRTGRQILFFGIVRQYKGLDILLRAMPKVLAEVDCRLLIAGEFYDPIELYLNAIHESHLDPYIEVRNRYVPNEDIQGLFDQADLLVMPYLNATQSGIVQMARRAALPVVATRTGGLAESVVEGESGLVCEPGDMDSLANAILKYFRGNMGPVIAEKLRQSVTVVEPSQLCLLIEALGEQVP
ncbi:MAG TPA: glycosyltransferase family 4 protein, partial [Blastocatellia bacterium]